MSKFSESTKDVQLSLLAVGFAGAIESLTKELPKWKSALVLHDSLKAIGMTEDDFRTLLNPESPDIEEALLSITETLETRSS